MQVSGWELIAQDTRKIGLGVRKEGGVTGNSPERRDFGENRSLL